MNNREAIEYLNKIDCENVTNVSCEYNVTGCSDCNFMVARSKAINALEEQEKRRWIPVSEKLPEEYMHCLVTRRNDYEDGFDTDVREDVYIELEGVWQWQSQAEGLIDDIIAWMPLPNPYIN